MSRGVLLFAHNSEFIDYTKLSVICACLVKKYLKVPVSLVIDRYSLEWMKQNDTYDKSINLFDTLIEVDYPRTDNIRKLYDGNDSKLVPFINFNRGDAWELTPYDTTLLLDTDYLIFSDTLNQYWEMCDDVLIAPSMKDVRGDRVGMLDKWISDTSIPMLWATTVFFTKNDNSKLFFDIIKYIRNNYTLYSEIYQYNPRMYRNDIAFSIAMHMFNGFKSESMILPPILTAQDKDLVYSMDDTGVKLIINSDIPTLCNIKYSDIHIINKQSIIRSSSYILENL